MAANEQIDCISEVLGISCSSLDGRKLHIGFRLPFPTEQH